MPTSIFTFFPIPARRPFTKLGGRSQNTNSEQKQSLRGCKSTIDPHSTRGSEGNHWSTYSGLMNFDIYYLIEKYLSGLVVNFTARTLQLAVSNIDVHFGLDLWSAY